MKTITFEPNGQNRTGEIVTALMHAPQGARVVFRKGTYDFFRDGSYRRYLFPGCNASGEKDVIFPLVCKKDITVDGGGSLFLFHDRLFPFLTDQCENITLRNFTVDFSFPRCLAAKIESMDETGIRLSVDRGKYRFAVQNRSLTVTAGTDLFSNCERRFFMQQRNLTCCYLCSGDVYYPNKNLPADVLNCDAEETDSGVFLQYRDSSCRPDFDPARPLLISFDEARENDVFFFEKSKNIVLENITVHSGAGMGFTGQCCENFNLIGCKVVPKQEDDLYSTTADAVLLTNFSGSVQIRDCLFDRTMDDAISVHGFYTAVDRITSPVTAVARFVHPSQSGCNIYSPGDVLTVSDGKTMRRKGTVRVERAQINNDPYTVTLTFSGPITEALHPGDFLENPERTPELIISGNTFRNTFSVRIGTAKKAVFERNRMTDCHGVQINDLLQFWSASGPTTDVTLRENVFENCVAPVSAHIDRVPDSQVKHGTVRLIGNRFIRAHTAIHAASVENLILSGNEFSDVSVPLTVSDCTTVLET